MKVQPRRFNGWRRLFLMPLLLPIVLLLVFAASLVLPGTALAQSETITVNNTAQLISRTTVRVSGMYTCNLPVGTQPDPYTAPYGIAIVNQTVRGKVLTAQGYFSVTCDGTSYPYQADITPSGSPPFHPGSASAQATFYAMYYDPSIGQYGSVFKSTDTVAIHIKG